MPTDDPEKKPLKLAIHPKAKGSGAGPVQDAPADNLFDADLDEFRDVGEGGSLGLVQLPATVELLKAPEKGCFVRTWANQLDWFPGSIHIPARSDLLSGGPNTVYLLIPAVAALLTDEVKKDVFLVPAVTAQSTFFMWYVPRDSTNSWNASMLRAADAAREHWVKIRSNRAESQYETTVATGLTHAPAWPEKIGGMLKAAFPGDRLVREREHALIKRLLGEAL